MLNAKRVEKPWGWELWWAHTERYVGKLLFIRAGHQLSLQYHEVKDEVIYVQEGEMDFLVDEQDGQGLRTLRMGPGAGFHIRPGTVHRMIAVTDVLVLEASSPEVDDVVRLEDAYGRAT